MTVCTCYKTQQNCCLIEYNVGTSHQYWHVGKAGSVAVVLGIVDHSLHAANWCNHSSNEVWWFLQVWLQVISSQTKWGVGERWNSLWYGCCCSFTGCAREACAVVLTSSSDGWLVSGTWRGSKQLALYGPRAFDIHQLPYWLLSEMCLTFDRTMWCECVWLCRANVFTTRYLSDILIRYSRSSECSSWVRFPEKNKQLNGIVWKNMCKCVYFRKFFCFVIFIVINLKWFLKI